MQYKDASECVHCHICRDSCAFLSKYGIDIGDTERLRELAYHCFLCGRCTEVCPLHIDGRQTVLGLRRERVAAGEKQAVEKDYKGLLREKKDYIYRNWKHATSGCVFFPGCNFPSMYPKTTAAISRMLAEHGIGTVYECCGKPVAELGLQQEEEQILERIRQKLHEHGITEIVTGCPNCRDFFGDRLGIRVTGIFSKFTELGIGNTVEGDFAFYLPCPDRAERKWIEEIRPFISGNIEYIEGVQCCGLGGSAIKYEPGIAAAFADRLRESISDNSVNSHTAAVSCEKQESSCINDNNRNIVTYCASCTGRFRRSGFSGIDHILTKVTGTNEAPDTAKSYFNRVLSKFR